MIEIYIYIYILIDPSATHLYITSKFMGKPWEKTCKVEKGFTIGISLYDSVNIDHAYKEVRFNINGCEIRIDFIPLELYDFR
jgi:hypothetical protein